MKARTGGTPPPRPGAVRVYPLVLAIEPDLVGAAMQRYSEKGWEPLEIDWKVHAFPVESKWVQVALWAIPPRREVIDDGATVEA